VQGDRVDTAGEGTTGRRHCQVIGACQAGDAIQQQKDILPALHHALRLLQRQLGNAGLILNRLIKGGGDDSPFTERRMSVTSSGRSPIRQTMMSMSL